MDRAELKSIILEVVEEIQQQKHIDEFVREFDGFNLKKEKLRLKKLVNHLAELKRNAANDLFTNETKHTEKFFALKQEIVNLNAKIIKYEETKDVVDCYARTHKTHVFNKHGKIV
jgi:hypothetical protein